MRSRRQLNRETAVSAVLEQPEQARVALSIRHFRRNVVSVDVEDYFHVEAFSDVVDRSEWGWYVSRVEANTNRVLDLLDDCGIRGTFFVLGWVSERHPGLVREISARGHELACHSFWHRRIYNLSREEFHDDTLRAKRSIEQAAGVFIDGYRAPSYSITSRSLWALEVLAELGFRYDSSVFPIRHDVYGMRSAPRAPFRVATPSGPIIEYPITTFRIFGSPNLPVGGGGYLRIFPFWYTRLGVERAWADHLPLITYIHPWELDPAQPRLPGRLKSRLRHYINLAKTEKRFRRVLKLGQFSSFRNCGLEKTANEVDLKSLTPL